MINKGLAGKLTNFITCKELRSATTYILVPSASHTCKLRLKLPSCLLLWLLHMPPAFWFSDPWTHSSVARSMAHTATPPCWLQSGATSCGGAVRVKGLDLMYFSCPFAVNKHCTTCACCACCLFLGTSSHALISSLGGTYLPFKLGHTHIILCPGAHPDHLGHFKLYRHPGGVCVQSVLQLLRVVDKDDIHPVSSTTK